MSLKGIRRLRMARTPEMADILARFVEEHQGKPFNNNLGQLLRAVANNNTKDDVSKGLFCSQLVALAYVQLGLLPESTVAANYMPSDFAAETIKGGFRGKLDRLLFVHKTGIPV